MEIDRTVLFGLPLVTSPEYCAISGISTRNWYKGVTELRNSGFAVHLIKEGLLPFINHYFSRGNGWLSVSVWATRMRSLFLFSLV